VGLWYDGIIIKRGAEKVKEQNVFAKLHDFAKMHDLPLHYLKI